MSERRTYHGRHRAGERWHARARLDKQLQGKNFFDVGQYPSAKFVADRSSFDGDEVTEVAGTLTPRGATHPATMKATVCNCYLNPLLTREACGGDFEATI